MARLVLGIVAALLLMSARLVAGQESIAAARDLYASAAYEDALAMLNRLPDSNRPSEEVNSIEQYRAFCLLALGRTAEAEHAIELIVAAEPSYRPANDLSPRVRNAFTDVRRRVLPSIIQQKYIQAKGAFDRKEFATAANGFSYVLDAMNDPDVAPQAGQPPLSDIRTLAVGFKDLSVTAAAPPPPPPAPMTAAPVQPPPAPKPPKIYTSNDAEVTGPAVIKQDLPPFPGQVVIPRQGMIEIVIDETGAVESAMMRIGVSAAYDQLALSSAKTWRYRPATLNGVPVKFRKAVQVTIKPIGPPR
jgi:tetratricopeptide (TPR) repeat protein